MTEEQKKYHRKYYIENKPRIKAYYIEHREHKLSCMKAYNAAHKEEIAARYQANKPYRLGVMKAYYNANKEKLKAYYQIHREEISKKRKKARHTKTTLPERQ